MIQIALVGFLVCLASVVVAQTGGDNSALEDKYSCPHGWTRYGSKKCLKYVNELQDYERAQATCRSKNHGTLVTIHSHDEQNLVYSYIHSIAVSSTPIWLGAKQIDFESILWLDKTENSYTNWAPSEPSHPDEICIAINPRNGMWHDVMCTEANVPACERAPTTQWPFFVAFCSEGWFQFNDEKCVRIISSQALNFYESQELCRSKYNSKLLSIKTDKESEFLHNLIKFRDVKLPVWLGAVQNDFSSFNWIDKSDVTFTNWAEGEPNDPDHACLSMIASGGKWSDNDCKEQKLILCQKAVPEDSSCETGWLQFRQDKCYRFVHIRLAFDDAESLCNNLYGGHLPSIHSQEEQFMISQFLASVNVKNGSEIWLGGRQMDFHNFNWGDGSLFNYSYWEHGEPNFPAEKCIEMSWRNGRWNDINCRLKRGVLCERPVSSRAHVKPILYQPINCLDSNCTTPLIGQSGIQSVSNGQQMVNDFSMHSANEFNSAPAPAPMANQNFTPVVVEATTPNSSSNSSSSTTQATTSYSNRTSSTSVTGEENSVAMMLPPDDKPIKVITSIMHRDQAQLDPTFEALANGTMAAEAKDSNNTYIHYNLPPPVVVSKSNEQQNNMNNNPHNVHHQAQPNQMSSKTAPATDTIVPSSSSISNTNTNTNNTSSSSSSSSSVVTSLQQVQDKTKEAPVVDHLMSAATPTASTSASSQQPFDLPNVPTSTASLMDKLKNTTNSSTTTIGALTTPNVLVE